MTFNHTNSTNGNKPDLTNFQSDLQAELSKLNQFSQAYNMALAKALYTTQCYGDAKLTSEQDEYIQKLEKAVKKYSKNPNSSYYSIDMIAIEINQLPSYQITLICNVLDWIDLQGLPATKGVFMARGGGLLEVDYYISIEKYVDLLWKTELASHYLAKENESATNGVA